MNIVILITAIVIIVCNALSCLVNIDTAIKHLKEANMLQAETIKSKNELAMYLTSLKELDELLLKAIDEKPKRKVGRPKKEVK